MLSLSIKRFFPPSWLATTKDDDYDREWHRCRRRTSLVTWKLKRFLRIDRERSPFVLLFFFVKRAWVNGAKVPPSGPEVKWNAWSFVIFICAAYSFFVSQWKSSNFLVCPELLVNDILRRVALGSRMLRSGIICRVGTLSSGNADGDGDAETCEKAGERTPLWREFTSIELHRRKPRFPHCQTYWHYWYSSSVYQDELGWLPWKEFAINSW